MTERDEYDPEIFSLLPRQGEGFFGEVYDNARGYVKFKRLLLARDPDDARDILTRETMQRLNGQPGGDYSIRVKELTPQEFVDKGRELIERGMNLPDEILEFGDLRRLQELQQVKELARRDFI